MPVFYCRFEALVSEAADRHISLRLIRAARCGRVLDLQLTDSLNPSTMKNSRFNNRQGGPAGPRSPPRRSASAQTTAVGTAAALPSPAGAKPSTHPFQSGLPRIINLPLPTRSPEPVTGHLHSTIDEGAVSSSGKAEIEPTCVCLGTSKDEKDIPVSYIGEVENDSETSIKNQSSPSQDGRPSEQPFVADAALDTAAHADPSMQCAAESSALDPIPHFDGEPLNLLLSLAMGDVLTTGP